MRGRKFKKAKNSEIISNDVMRNGMLLGCHQGMTKKDLLYICKIFKKFIKKTVKISK